MSFLPGHTWRIGMLCDVVLTQCNSGAGTDFTGWGHSLLQDTSHQTPVSNSGIPRPLTLLTNWLQISGFQPAPQVQEYSYIQLSPSIWKSSSVWKGTGLLFCRSLRRILTPGLMTRLSHESLAGISQKWCYALLDASRWGTCPVYLSY